MKLFFFPVSPRGVSVACAEGLLEESGYWDVGGGIPQNVGCTGVTLTGGLSLTSFPRLCLQHGGSMAMFSLSSTGMVGLGVHFTLCCVLSLHLVPVHMKPVCVLRRYLALLASTKGVFVICLLFSCPLPVLWW